MLSLLSYQRASSRTRLRLRLAFTTLTLEQPFSIFQHQNQTYDSSLPSKSSKVTRHKNNQECMYSPPTIMTNRNNPILQTRSFSSGGQPLGNIFNNASTGQQQQQQDELPPLEKYGTDLTQLARDGKLDPVIGRHLEIRRTLQILARRTKNNPLLIGEPGVGKTAIAEGLAQRIASGDVPDSMKHKTVVSLDVASLISGAVYRGQFEERLKSILQAMQDANGSVILFIDEMHTIMMGSSGGKGSSSGQMDMRNMLKPSLARGELQLVGATTLDEYRTSLETDAALARRFQTVYVAEPNVEDTISILRGLKSSYELHHGILIKDEALIAASTLSERYVSDRKQPDKSIDLVDEACSRLRLEQESKPEVIWNVERDLLTKQIEKTALESETMDDSDTQFIQKRKIVQQQVVDLETERTRLVGIWQAEKDELERGKKAKEALEQAKRDLQMARSKGDFSQAGELLNSTIPQLEWDMEEMEKQQHGDANQSANNGISGRKKGAEKRKLKMLSDAVTAEAIANIVARQTGIPVSRITGSESKKLLHMEDKLRERVVGQEDALNAVSNCVRLARTQLQAQDRTSGNFLFLGPTGVGKTELCKTLAEFIFDDQNAMTRVDMSEYGEKHTVSRLIGAPPGYVGYEEGGVLTESIRRRPYQVLLLDEFEKGNRDVWNLLLQVFDEGHLTDSHGRKVDFRNVIVVMTSNMGAQVIADLPPHLLGSEPEVQDMIMNVVRGTLSPELLNRIDETIVFNRLQREHMDRIAEIGVQDIADRLKRAQNMTLQVSKSAFECLAENGYDIRYGARPLKRTLARDLLHPLSRLVLEGGVMEGDMVRVCTRGEADKNDNPANDNDDDTNRDQTSSEPTTATPFPKDHRSDNNRFGFVSSSSIDNLNNKNAIVVLRNHPSHLKDEDTGDEDEY